MSERTTRAQRATAWVLAMIGAVAAIASVIFGLYAVFPWFDEALHAYNFFALTLLVAVYAHGAMLTGAREHGFLLILFIAVFGLGMGAAWEIAEFGYDHFIAKPNVILPKLDTIVDMLLDTAGALVAGLVCLKMLRR